MIITTQNMRTEDENMMSQMKHLGFLFASFFNMQKLKV